MTARNSPRPMSNAHSTCCSAIGPALPHQPAQVVVLEPRSGNDERRARGDLSPEAAAAGLYRAARLRLLADLSVPRCAGADASTSNRHRTVQVCLVQAGRDDRVDAEPRLLEAGAALSRCHRMDDHPQPLDVDAPFAAGKLDMTFPYEVTVPLLRQLKEQAPDAICELRPRGVASTLIVNRDAPPFNNPSLRRAMALTLDRKAFVD